MTLVVQWPDLFARCVRVAAANHEPSEYAWEIDCGATYDVEGGRMWVYTSAGSAVRQIPDPSAPN